MARKRYARRAKKGKVAKATKRYVKKILDDRIEDKQAGTLVAAFNPTDTLTSVLLNGISQGTNQGERIGMAVRAKKLICRVLLNQNSSIAIARMRCRLLFFWDKQPNGGAPTLSQLFTTTTAGLTLYSPININGQKRYRILSDKIYDFPVDGGATDTPHNRSIVKSFKLKTITKYSGGGNAIGDINTNALYIGLIGQTANGMTASFSYDFRYEDA